MPHVYMWHHLFCPLLCAHAAHQHSFQIEWVMPHTGIRHTWMSHVVHLNESCHTREWVMSHTWMCHVTHENTSCHIHERVMSYTWLSHVTHMNESCHTRNTSGHTHEWVMSYTWIRHVTHMNESCHTHEWVMSLLHTRAHVQHTSILWRIQDALSRIDQALFNYSAVFTLAHIHTYTRARVHTYIHTHIHTYTHTHIHTYTHTHIHTYT